MNPYFKEMSRMVDKLFWKTMPAVEKGLQLGRKGEPLTLLDIGIMQQWRHLASDRLTIGDFEGSLKVSRRSLTKQLKDLQQAGYVLKCVDPEDKRRGLYTLTKQGELLAEELCCVWEGWLKEILRDTTPNECKAFLKFLSRINQMTVHKYRP